MTYEDFIESHRAILDAYWQHIASKIQMWKRAYEWPRGVRLAEAMSRRDHLESALRLDLETNGWINKQAFDEVMVWGFGHPSHCTEAEVRVATEEAFGHLHQGRLADAARALTWLPGVGISRASKVLALSNQRELAIYDSRAADGLSDLVSNDRRLILVPPGRVILGDLRSSADFCRAFEDYIWVLTYLREKAVRDPAHRDDFARVADLEIAFFARSRARVQPAEHKAAQVRRQEAPTPDEGDEYRTLGYGQRARQFWATVSEEGITIFAGAGGAQD